MASQPAPASTVAEPSSKPPRTALRASSWRTAEVPNKTRAMPVHPGQPRREGHSSSRHILGTSRGLAPAREQCPSGRGPTASRPHTVVFTAEQSVDQPPHTLGPAGPVRPGALAPGRTCSHRGSITSSTIRSGRNRSATESSSRPVVAAATSKPTYRRLAPNICTRWVSSSTTRIREPFSSGAICRTPSVREFGENFDVDAGALIGLSSFLPSFLHLCESFSMTC